MARTYQLRRRAERQQETRQRIVEAAVDLHTTIGPARTTVSAIADRAGVQRHTFYRHFPDERSLSMACSGLHMERYPLPDLQAWRGVADAHERLRRGLSELYRYYDENAALLGPIMRDVAVHPLTQEVVALRMGPWFDEARAVLAEPFRWRGAEGTRRRALIDLFLDFHAWRRLRSGVPAWRDAVDAAVRAIACPAEAPRGRQPHGVSRTPQP